MGSIRERLRHWLLTALVRRRGEVRATRDLRRVGDVVSLAGVFSATMIVPIAFLAFLAVSSLRNGEFSLDQDLQARARAITADIDEELRAKFTKFEESVEERIARSESPTENLGQLSPYLRAAYRFDEAGELAAPFTLPTPDNPDLSLGWLRQAREARLLAAHDAAAAVEAWRTARYLTADPAAIGESMLGEANALAAAGRTREASAVLSDLVLLYGTTRDRRGFRLGDLANLALARIELSRNDAPSAVARLTSLVDQLFATQWTIGREGEPTVMREALTILARYRDPDWVARARSRLTELHGRIAWSQRVLDEIELVYSRIPDAEFRYVGAQRADSVSVWAIYRAGPDTYTFSFSAEQLRDELRASVRKVADLNRDLGAKLYLDRDPPEPGLSTRTFGPWLPSATVAVEPTDPNAIATEKNRRWVVRIAIVLTAVFVSFVGAMWIGRFVTWEIETGRQRADFAANVSHELRSPITQIRLKGEALQLGLVEPGDDMQQHFDAIVRECERLSRLVDNVLDFSAIERGAKRYQLRPDDLASTVQASIDAIRRSADEYGITLDVSIDEDLPPLWIDRDAIGQVMTNLLSNAMKYGAGGRWIGVKLVRVGGPRGWVHVSVEDRGFGINAAEVPHVFDDFFRSSDPRVRRTKGTGIGLAIVRYIVEAHRGKIRVESALGQGARFIVELPIEPPSGAGERS